MSEAFEVPLNAPNAAGQWEVLALLDKLPPDGHMLVARGRAEGKVPAPTASALERRGLVERVHIDRPYVPLKGRPKGRPDRRAMPIRITAEGRAMLGCRALIEAATEKKPKEFGPFGLEALNDVQRDVMLHLHRKGPLPIGRNSGLLGATAAALARRGLVNRIDKVAHITPAGRKLVEQWEAFDV